MVEGRQPVIAAPDIEQIPTIAIATPVAWGSAHPAPAKGLKVQAFADGLDHPRWLYTLPNGDVLVGEANSPPRKTSSLTDRIMGWLLGRAGAGVPSANRITLLRDANGDGVAEVRSTLMAADSSPLPGRPEPKEPSPSPDAPSPHPFRSPQDCSRPSCAAGPGRQASLLRALPPDARGAGLDA